MSPPAAIILAAGKGTRLNAPENQNKVVFPINGRPMIDYSVATLEQLHIQPIVAVVGHAADSVKAVLKERVIYVTQEMLNGTASAVKCALPKIPENNPTVLVMYGDDSAFYSPELLSHLVAAHQAHQNAITLVTIQKSDPTGLGRIIRNEQGDIMGIVEEKVATTKQKEIREINTGLYCFNTSFLKASIEAIDENPISHEYYLTDLVAVAVAGHKSVEALLWPDESIWHGVNTKEQLAVAETKMTFLHKVQ
jgi:UDP-N-acetylglucosamine diphosphorylase/glucosamine-1-phosphate N-acetyltransferase